MFCKSGSFCFPGSQPCYTPLPVKTYNKYGLDADSINGIDYE